MHYTKKKATNRWLLAMMLGLFITRSLAGQSIIGQINDQNGPAPFANVLLLQPTDSLLIKGAVAGVDGRFSIEAVRANDYLLKITSAGYQEFFQHVTVTSGTTNLGTLTIREDAQQLDEVVVQAQRPLFEQKIDRTVVNVQSSITASSGTALDVLEKSPGVTVDRSNNSLALAGKQGVRVMINGKMTRMPMQAVVQMLNGTNAENVETIELITTPPAKYEAEGDAGIINIVMKKATDEGTNGSYSVFAGYGQREKWGGNVNFNHRKKKFNLFGNYAYRKDATFQVFGNNRILENNDGTSTMTDTNSDRDAFTATQSAQLGFDYQATDQLIVGGGLNIFRSNWEMDALNTIRITTDGSLDSGIDLYNQEINNFDYIVGNFNVSYDLSEKSNLSAELDYIDFDSFNPTSYQQEDYDANDQLIGTEEFRSGKITPIKTWVPRIDYTLSLSDNTNFEAGLKAAINELENDVSVENLMGELWTLDPELSQVAFLNEDIFAAYSSISFKASPKLDMKVGLRYEHTITNIDTQTEQDVVDRNFGKVFPSVFLNRKINDSQSWVLSYSRRITRPTFRDIAPFVIFLDPNTFWTGNEALLPATTDAVRAEYRYKAYLISFQFSRDDAAIANFQPRIEGERQLTSAENLDYRNNFNVSLTLPITVNDWWDMQYNVTGNYQETFVNHLEQEIALSNANLQFNGSNSFKLPKNWKFELSGFFFTPGYFGISKFRSAGALNLGLEKKLNEERGTFRLSLTDAFNNRNFIGETLIPEENLNVRRSFFLESQIVNLSFSRNFGNNKLKKLRNKGAGSREEQGRL